MGMATAAMPDVLASQGTTVSKATLREGICDLLPSIIERGKTIGTSLEGLLLSLPLT
jgi:hypothetical protein